MNGCRCCAARATLEFADGERVELNEGDSLTIPRHVRHRVAQTSEETIWLAVHHKNKWLFKVQGFKSSRSDIARSARIREP